MNTRALWMALAIVTIASPTAAVRPHITAAVTKVFRTDAVAAYRLIEPICGTTLNPDLLKRYEPLDARLTALGARTTGTPFYAILIEAKRNHDGLAAVVDCARPVDKPDTVAYVEKDLAAADLTLSRMEQTVARYAPQKG